MIMGFIIYKNSRKYSNIKFTDIDECKEFIKFNGDYDEAASKGWYFDFYKYPSGKKGFNAACMPVVPGMHPDNKKEIIMKCNELIKKYNVQFENISYDSLYIPTNSTIYLDPPYKMFLNENASGIYNSDEFNLKSFYNWCNETSKDCNMLVSFDGGTAGDEGFPECNGWTKITNDTGTSKFRRQMSKTREPNKVLKQKNHYMLN